MPQLGSHSHRSGAGVLELSDGQIVVYAVFVAESDNDAGAATTIGCVGFEVLSTYSGVPGTLPAQCVN
jgi:hypothetical protein